MVLVLILGTSFMLCIYLYRGNLYEFILQLRNYVGVFA